MSNIINTTNIDSENAIYAKKILNNNTSRFSSAPTKLPKYSVDLALKERDTFRKNTELNIWGKKKSEENNRLFKKLLFAFVAAATFVILETKKII